MVRRTFSVTLESGSAAAARETVAVDSLIIAGWTGRKQALTIAMLKDAPRVYPG